MLKRYVSLVLAVVMAMTVCAAFAEEQKYVDPWNYVDPSVKADITIYRYYADADKTNMDFAIEQMKAKYPNLTINIEARVGSDNAALRDWAAIGELPDIMEINSSDVFNLLKDNGDLYVMDEAVEKTGFYSLFTNGDAAKKARTNADGHQYAFGCEASNLGCMWYNVELFEELGLKEPTNYEEFKAVIVALRAAGKTPISLFSAEKWPATTLYSWACIAEGVPEGVDGINDGLYKITDEPFVKAAEKYLEIANLGAFSASALTTNYQQAYEAVYNKEAGFFLSGAWFFLGLEGDGMGEKLQWCKYNPFADADQADAVRFNAFGGAQTEPKYSVNSNPPCGLDAETVAYLGMEFEWWTRISAGLNGVMTTAVGNFEFSGSTGYREYYELYGNYTTFTNFTGDLSNADFLSVIDTECELVITGNVTDAATFVNDISSRGF